MKSFLSGCTLALIAAAGGAGCQNPTVPVDAHQARIPTLAAPARPANTHGLSSRDVNAGAKLVVAKCARCHPLYDPNAYNDAQWHYWLTRMSQKAHLNSEQQNLTSRYLGAFREPK